MVEADNDQKTEEPTGKRIEEAREEGQLPISREMATWFMFIGVLIVVGWLGPQMAKQMLGGLRVFLEKPEQISLVDGGLQNALIAVMAHVALASVLVFALLLVVSMVGTMIQTGFYVNPARIKFDVEKLMPIHGFRQLFSMNSVAELVKSFVKLVVLGFVAFKTISPVVDSIPLLVQGELLGNMSFLHDRAVHLIIILMLVITVVAIADLLFVRFRYFKGLRMTKQEVKDEHKQMEGDPMVKGRLRSIRLEKARRRMMAQVPKADVIITNPTHFAVALQYDGSKMMAPVMLAKGADRIAARIREVAEEHKIPIVSNPPLARALYDTVEVDEPISPQHYRAVAEIISYVYKIKRKLH